MMEYQTTNQFHQSLLKGNFGEEKVAELFTNLGFSVWRIGSYRLPVDLLVWNDSITFWVQVKTGLKTKQLQIHVKDRKFWMKAEEETGCPVIVIEVYQGNIIFIDWKNRYIYKDYSIEGGMKMINNCII